MHRAFAWAATNFAAVIIALLLCSFAMAQQGSSPKVKGELGVKLETVTPEIARERNLLPFGALVTEVTKDGAAANAGIAVGDLIQMVNDRPVQRAEDIQAVLDPLEPGVELGLTLVHAGQIKQTRVTLLAPQAPPPPVVTGDPILMLDTGGHMAPIKGLAFTRDGNQIVSAGDDKVIRVWDWRAGKTARIIRGSVGAGALGHIYAIALSPDQRWLAVGGFLDLDRSDVRLYDFASGRLVRLLRGHTSSVQALAFARDSRRLISGADDNTAILWDIDSGRLLNRLEGHRDFVYAVAFSPDGERVITGSFDHTLRIWRASDGGLIRVMDGHAGKVMSVAVRRADGRIASGDTSGEVRLWDGRTGQFLRTLAKQSAQQTMWSLAFSPDGTKLLATCGDFCPAGYVQYVWDVADGKELTTYTGHNNSVFASDISPDGRLAATGGGTSHEINVWELATGHRVSGPDGRFVALRGIGEPTWAVGFSSDSKLIAWGTHWERAPGGSGDSSETGSPLAFQLYLPRFGESLGAPQPIAASGGGQFVRANKTYGNLSLFHHPGSDGYNNAVLDIRRDSKVLASLEREPLDGFGHWAYTFTVDGRTIVSGGANGLLHGYDIAKALAKGGMLKGTDLRNLAHEFIGHEGVVWAVTPSPDGRYLVSGSNDQTVRLWNLKTQELIVTVFRGVDGEWAIWTPQGYYAASPNGEALVGWNVNHGANKEAEWVTAEQMRGVFYRPDVVAKAIALASAEDALKEAGLGLTAAEAIKSKPLPVIRGATWPPAGMSVSGGKGIIAIAVEKSAAPPTSWEFKVGGFDDKAGADVTVTAEPVPAPAGHAPVAADEDLYAFEIPLHAGQNRVTFFARNDNGDSQKWEYPIFHEGEGDLDARGTLHILAIGVDRYPTAKPTFDDLSFAGLDAKEFAQAAAQAMKGRNKDVDVVTLCQVEGCTKPPTLQNILSSLDRIARANEHDTVVVFLAGHGDNAGSKYFFLPTDFQRSGASTNALDWARVEDALGRARGAKLLFVDACHSGASFNDTLLNDARQRNVIAFTSAGPNEVALEDADIKHGVFTYWLLKGLAGGAANSAHAVTVYDLGYYLAKEVPSYAARRHFSRQDPIFASLSNPAIAWP
jgi:WD40 repeat protein